MALRIVLVDDDEKLGELLRVNFELDERFELVGSARNGLEGVRVVSEAQPDAVLMDLHMPLLGGIAATRRIVEADPRACVIAFTASRDTAEHDAARRAGAAAVLPSRSTLSLSSTPSRDTRGAARPAAPTPTNTRAAAGRAEEASSVAGEERRGCPRATRCTGSGSTHRRGSGVGGARDL
jgi:CheY-like chemotaxis protein